MDNIKKILEKNNICPLCHNLLDPKNNYNTHIKNCKGEDTTIITTKFYTKDEIKFINPFYDNDDIIIRTTFLKAKRPATR